MYVCLPNNISRKNKMGKKRKHGFSMKYKNAQWKINNDENHPRSEFRVILFIAFNPKNQQLTPETANTRYGHYVLCIHKCCFLATSGYIELSLFSVIKKKSFMIGRASSGIPRCINISGKVEIIVCINIYTRYAYYLYKYSLCALTHIDWSLYTILFIVFTTRRRRCKRHLLCNIIHL